jgi:competence protein ComEC
MKVDLGRALEHMVKHRIYMILLAISWGIGMRFQYFEISTYTSMSIAILFWGLYYLSYRLYNTSVIRSDLCLLANRRIGKYAQLTVNIHLSFIILTTILMWFAIGITAASIRFELMMSPEKIIKQVDDIYIIGRVSQLEIRDKGVRIYLDKVYESNRFKDVLEKIEIGNIRLNLRHDLRGEDVIGKWVFLRATLMAPPSAAFPNSFDFAQYALFKGIGAIGYALQKPVIVEQLESKLGWSDVINQWLNILRKKIAYSIKNAITDPAAGIAAAILVGETSQIDPDDYYALRVAGLAHIIAISGMHVVVVVGIAFFFVRAVLLYFVPIVLRFQIALYLPVPKVSALVSIALSAFYVFLSGAPVSAQRALITSAIVMLCLVYDKRLDPIKSLCLVAAIMLLLTPEVLFSPGLQMSFAACFALIATFTLMDRSIKFKSQYIEYFFKLTIASTSASIATAPFIIYHFNQFAPYGLIANLVCVPLSDFVIMPFGMASMFLMPFGVERYLLIVVQYSIDFMLWIARKISEMPMADIHLSGFTSTGIIIISLGLFVLCICSRGLYRAIGLLLMLMGCFFVERYDNILLLVSPKTFAIRHDLVIEGGDERFIFSSKQRDRFTHEVWQGKLGSNKFINDSLNTITKKKHIQNCKSDFCMIEHPYKIIIINRLLEDKIEDLCNANKPQIFINMHDTQSCIESEINITSDDLKKYGTHIISGADKLKILTSK